MNDLKARADAVAAAYDECVTLGFIFSPALDRGKLTKLIADQAARIAELEVSHARYEHVRTLSPNEFHGLWMEAAKGAMSFDELVDQRRAKA